MKPFAAPLDDIFFCLNHVSGASDLPDWDGDFLRDLAEHFASFAEGEIAPLDEPGDIQGARLENGRVRMPAGFREVYQAYAEQGWTGLPLPEAYGGQGMGPLALAVVSEIFSAACQSLQMVTALVPGAARTILRFGTEDQKQSYLPDLASGVCLSTMCLTEPGAGSDLGRIRCKAVEEEGQWKIHGEKIFISGGDQDLTDKILHLVLARTSDDGIRGLSLFLCHSDAADGSRNKVGPARIEEKMGLHASPTCHMVFDGAEAELIGNLGDGLKAMFTMMNHARLDVALQGVAHSSRAYDVASSYAAERVQGRGADGTPITLDGHADVQRMLEEIDGLALSSRALVHTAFAVMEKGDNRDLVEFLTPLAKACCTDAGIKAAELGVQVLGGYGYLREYRLEQTYRDARISAIYEGANGIHARMLATRLLGTAPGDAFDAYIAQAAEGNADIAAILELWRNGRTALAASQDPTPMASDFMKLTELTLMQVLWHRILQAAPNHPNPDRILRVADRALKTARAFAPAYLTRIQS